MGLTLSKQTQASPRLMSTLSENARLLIEAISNLVISTITGDPREVGVHARSLGEYTIKVVEHAKQIAQEAKDANVTKQIVKCNNEITQQIEKLVGNVVNLMSNFQDPGFKKSFATNARDTGFAINDLIKTADSAVCLILIHSVRTAIQYQQELQKVINLSENEFTTMAKSCGQFGSSVLARGAEATRNCAASNKASLITHSVNELRPALVIYIKQAKECHLGQIPANNPDLMEHYNNLARVYNDIIQAAEIPADYSDQIRNAFSEFNRLLDLARAAHKAAGSLLDAVMNGASPAEFDRLINEVETSTLGLLEQAERALAQESDPIRREQICQAISSTKANLADLINTARAAQADPSNQELKKQVANKKQSLDRNIDRLVALTSKGMEEQKLAHTMDYLGQVTNQLMNNAASMTPEQLREYATRIHDITDRVAKDAKAVAMKTENPDQRTKILNAVGDLRKAEDRFVGDIHSLAEKPGDAERIQRMNNTHSLFRNQLDKVRYATGLAQEPPQQVRAAAIQSSGSNDLVAAAQEQANLAGQVIRDAQMLMNQMNDPNKKEQLRRAIEQLQLAQTNLLKAAQVAAADPDNLDKQIALDEAQRVLADGIKNVINLTSTAAGELQQMLDQITAEDESEVSSVFSQGNQLTAEIERFMQNLSSMDPKDVAMKAKELAALANQLAAMVRNVANDTKDPKTKQDLIDFSKFMRDNGTQLKMIAAVKVACGGDDGQISSAAKGLCTTVSETLSVLRVSELKRRRERTAGRAAQIQQIIEMWQQRR